MKRESQRARKTSLCVISVTMSELQPLGPGVMQPRVFASSSKKATGGSVLTAGEKKSIVAARTREGHENEEQGRYLRLVICGYFQADEEEPENGTLFEKLKSAMSVGELESRSSSSPAGVLKMKLAKYFYNPSFTFEGGPDDYAGVVKNTYIQKLEEDGQLGVLPSYFERPGLVDDEAQEGGEDREFVIESGRVLVSKATTLSLKLPAAQVRLFSYRLISLTFTVIV